MATMSIISPAASQAPEQTHKDLINCTLLAQRLASAEVGDITLVNAWYAACLRALTTLGWAGRKATCASRNTTLPATLPVPCTTPRTALRR